MPVEDVVRSRDFSGLFASMELMLRSPYAHEATLNGAMSEILKQDEFEALAAFCLANPAYEKHIVSMLVHGMSGIEHRAMARLYAVMHSVAPRVIDCAILTYVQTVVLRIDDVDVVRLVQSFAAFPNSQPLIISIARALVILHKPLLVVSVVRCISDVSERRQFAASCLTYATVNACTQCMYDYAKNAPRDPNQFCDCNVVFLMLFGTRQSIGSFSGVHAGHMSDATSVPFVVGFEIPPNVRTAIDGDSISQYSMLYRVRGSLQMEDMRRHVMYAISRGAYNILTYLFSTDVVDDTWDIAALAKDAFLECLKLYAKFYPQRSARLERNTLTWLTEHYRESSQWRILYADTVQWSVEVIAEERQALKPNLFLAMHAIPSLRNALLAPCIAQHRRNVLDALLQEYAQSIRRYTTTTVLTRTAAATQGHTN